MTTAKAANIHTIALEGTFDDAQSCVKNMFNNEALRNECNLCGVNSINLARILFQTVYYFTSAVALGAPHRPVCFVVPTGNFGDIFAGWMAKRMGLPVDRLVIATNSNDILARTLASGRYAVQLGPTWCINPGHDPRRFRPQVLQPRLLGLPAARRERRAYRLAAASSDGEAPTRRRVRDLAPRGRRAPSRGRR